jgi:hypothetical protein
MLSFVGMKMHPIHCGILTPYPLVHDRWREVWHALFFAEINFQFPFKMVDKISQNLNYWVKVSQNHN